MLKACPPFGGPAHLLDDLGKNPGKKVFKISYFYADFRSPGIVSPIVIHIFGRLTPLFEGFVWNFDDSKPVGKTGYE